MYDYSNPKRFFAEPLMRYVWTLMIGMICLIVPFFLIAYARHDGGKWLLENVPFSDTFLSIWFLAFIPILILYTILYYSRSWGNSENKK